MKTNLKTITNIMKNNSDFKCILDELNDKIMEITKQAN